MQNGGRKGEKFRGGEGEAENIPARPKKITEGGGQYVDRGEICWGGAETAILFREIYC